MENAGSEKQGLFPFFKFMTVPNYITIFRLMLVPVFVTFLLDYANFNNEGSWWIAVITFCAASVSDGIDGYIARRFKQRSELGAFLDPLADKLLLLSGIVVLSFPSDYLPQLPLWTIGMIFGRDLILLLGYLVINHWVGRVKVRPHFLSKCATVLQMVLVAWGVLGCKHQFGLGEESPFFFYWCLLATVLTGLTLFIYFPAGMAQLRAVPASSPSEDQSRNMAATNIEVDSPIAIPNKKKTRNDAGNEENG